jgi:hypothetical protein
LGDPGGAVQAWMSIDTGRSRILCRFARRQLTVMVAIGRRASEPHAVGLPTFNWIKSAAAVANQ